MVEKDVEYMMKELILSVNKEFLTITNEFSSDGIVRFNGRPVAILEFKIRKNLANENTIAQIYTQAMCYYCKLLEKETVEKDEPFYIIVGDDNEIGLLNLHDFPAAWTFNQKWTSVAPSRSAKEEELLNIAKAMLNIVNPVYYKYDDIKELAFGFHLLFTNSL